MTNKGFTLVEMLVTVILASLALGMLGMIYMEGIGSAHALQSEANVLHNARRAIHQVSADLRRSRNVSIPASPNNSSLSTDLPVYETTPGAGYCTAFKTQGVVTGPETCTQTSDCQSLCGATSSCFKVTGAANGHCVKRYTYVISTANNTPQLVVTADAGDENTLILGNNIQAAKFENSVMDANLRPDEIRIELSARELSSYDKQTHQTTLDSIVHLRN